jgi:GNAT superfamily N-acetyltransferase
MSTSASFDGTEIVIADLTRAAHQVGALDLLDAYACDPMGDGKPLTESARHNLIPGLMRHPTTAVFLAYRADVPVGLAICFGGFSTFAGRPLLNISDYFVVSHLRGQGTGRQLMHAIEKYARETSCCKITLEVQQNNHRARETYAAAGFTQAVYVTEGGGSLFLSKSLAD